MKNEKARKKKKVEVKGKVGQGKRRKATTQTERLGPGGIEKYFVRKGREKEK